MDCPRLGGGREGRNVVLTSGTVSLRCVLVYSTYHVNRGKAGWFRLIALTAVLPLVVRPWLTSLGLVESVHGHHSTNLIGHLPLNNHYEPTF